MAIVTLNDARIYMAEFNLSGDHNKIGLEVGRNDSLNTVFGNAATSVKGTTAFATLAGQGFVTLGTGNVHAVLGAQINVNDVPVTVTYNGATEGDACEFFTCLVGRYDPFAVGDVGEHMGFAVSAKSVGTQSVGGTIVGVGSKTATGNGSEYSKWGTMTSTDTVYSALHVLSVSGTSPTLDVIIESDTTGFPSPSTVLTFTQKTAVGSQFISKSTGLPSSDTYWRAKWTIGGTDTPTFDIVVSFGVESHA